MARKSGAEFPIVGRDRRRAEGLESPPRQGLGAWENKAGGKELENAEPHKEVGLGGERRKVGTGSVLQSKRGTGKAQARLVREEVKRRKEGIRFWKSQEGRKVSQNLEGGGE